MSNSNVRYDLATNRRAIADEHGLFTIDYQGKSFPEGSDEYRGRITLQGPMSPTNAKLILAFVDAIKGKLASPDVLYTEYDDVPPTPAIFVTPPLELVDAGVTTPTPVLCLSDKCDAGVYYALSVGPTCTLYSCVGHLVYLLMKGAEMRVGHPQEQSPAQTDGQA